MVDIRRPDNGTSQMASRLRIHSPPSLATDRQNIEDFRLQGFNP
jgi:hypothetical protein